MAEKGKKSKRRKIKQRRIAIGLLVVIALIIFIVWGYERKKNLKVKTVSADDVTAEKYIEERPELDVELLPVNSYSRPGTTLEEVRGIVIHYTANPGSTARQNRDYFAGLAESHETSASSHFVIGLQGEIVQCIPCNEIAYASNERNGDTIAIECCIEDESGKFNSDTYRSLVELTSWLIGRYDLCVEDVIRHYDVTGKNCPKYFVEHENAWEDFKNDIISYIDENGVEKVE